jgi:hypothetical protein
MQKFVSGFWNLPRNARITERYSIVLSTNFYYLLLAAFLLLWNSVYYMQCPPTLHNFAEPKAGIFQVVSMSRNNVYRGRDCIHLYHPHFSEGSTARFVSLKSRCDLRSVRCSFKSASSAICVRTFDLLTTVTRCARKVPNIANRW